MSNRLTPAIADCIGCHFCELHLAKENRNVLHCMNPAIQTMPVDTSKCFEQSEVHNDD